MHKTTDIITRSLIAASLGLFLAPALPMRAEGLAAPVAAPPVETFTVKGIVVDNTGETLPRATVFVKGTTNGTSAGIDGDFSLKVPKAGKVTLVVSFVGMTTKEVTTTTGSNVTITLEPTSDTLEEVIVSGFHTISRERNTGSAVVVNSEKLSKIQAPDLTSKLEGLTPGLTT